MLPLPVRGRGGFLYSAAAHMRREWLSHGVLRVSQRVTLCATACWPASGGALTRRGWENNRVRLVKIRGWRLGGVRGGAAALELLQLAEGLGELA